MVFKVMGDMVVFGGINIGRGQVISGNVEQTLKKIIVGYS